MAAREDTLKGSSKRPRMHQRTVPKHLALFDLIQSVVVGGDTSVIHLVKADYDGVADATLIDRHDLANFPVPVGLRSQNAHLQHIIDGKMKRVLSGAKVLCVLSLIFQSQSNRFISGARP